MDNTSIQILAAYGEAKRKGEAAIQEPTQVRNCEIERARRASEIAYVEPVPAVMASLLGNVFAIKCAASSH